jgi:molecular chaperone GrpE
MTDIDGEPVPGATGDGGASGEQDAGPATATAQAIEERDARYTRLAADFENFRKRTAREHSDRSRYASEDAARALLPVLDNLRRAIEHAPEDTPASLLEGLEFTLRQFEEALASLGVTVIDAKGRPFDPAEHEAVLGEESPEVELDTVVDVLQRGYKLHDRVLRPAMVKVAHPRPQHARRGGDGVVEA